jgi:valyl-tRNA synthetase
VGAKASAPVLGRLSADGYDAVGGQLARLARFEWADGAGADDEVVATVPIPGGGVEVLPSEAFDAGEARARIEKKRAGLRKEVERAERRLANEGFVAKAPAAVVDEERRKLEEYREALARLEG